MALRLRRQDLAAALAFLAAALLGTHYFLRSQALYGPTWSDGQRRYDSRSGDEVRHAVWGPPEVLLAHEEARDPTLAPDGRLLVFVVGERGLNAELFACELQDGRPGPPERLALCSAADELAPAFAPGYLYFASDRPGGSGGLDLWRAPYAAGQLGTPEPVPAGINSPADETDPAPGGAAEAGVLYLASNRARGLRQDFALYRARPDAGSFVVQRLAALDSPFDEREPSPAADGRALLFASDRSGGRGGFDLWRSLRPRFSAPAGPEDESAEWQPPTVLGELTTERDERGPWTSPEGFALLYEGRDADDAPVLLRARARELLLLPPPGVSLAEWLLLAGLLLSALLALLARRWRPLDILYKCLLVSLLLHLLLMLYLRTIEPSTESKPFGREAGPAYRVRLAPAETGIAQAGAATRALQEPLAAPQRERFSPAEASDLAARPVELPKPTAGPEAWPKREAAPPARSSSEAVRLADHEGPLERYAAQAPKLALPGQRSAGAPLRPGSEPERESALAAQLPGARPAEAPAHAGPRSPSEEASPPPALRAVRQTDPASATGMVLAGPREDLAPAAGAAPRFELPGWTAVTPARQAPPGATPRRESAAPLPDALEGVIAPVALDALAAPMTDVRPPERSGAPGAALVRAPAPALRAVREDPAPRPPRTGPGFDALAGLGPAAARPPSGAALDTAPRRVPTTHAPGSPGPRPAPARLLEAPDPLGADRLAAVGRAPERVPAPRPVDRAPELRLPDEVAPPNAAPAPRPPFEALGELPVAARERPAVPEPSAPARLLPGAAPGPAAALTPQQPRWTLPEPRLETPGLPDREPPRLERSAYQNRFGDQKLRALEEFGGTRETEHAVAQGLAYLAAIQERDGSWGERSDAHAKYQDVRPGKTGLALLAFLGAGHLPWQEGLHAETVEGAVGFLLRAQQPNGHFGNSGPYSHGIATYALAEALALTRDARLRAPVEQAVARIVETQSHDRDPRRDGGWGYFFADDHVWNRDRWPRTSVTAWQVMALESARLSGLAVPDQTFGAARTFLLGAWDPEARAFRYDHDPSRLASGYPILPASTPAALFALSLLGLDAAGPELEPARRFVLLRKPDGYRYTGDDDFVRRARGNLYFWYYGTLALFRVGGRTWETWNQALKETLLPAQRADGSWAPLDVYGEYAGDEDDESAYTTALCVLTLEVYYRYFTPLLEVR